MKDFKPSRRINPYYNLRSCDRHSRTIVALFIGAVLGMFILAACRACDKQPAPGIVLVVQPW